MANKLELGLLDGMASEANEGAPATPSHTHDNCSNCAAKLQGPFCHRCGQSADDHHRSVGHLLWEVVEGLTHFDGRLANTLPALLFHAGRLARDHIEGRRMRHVPPFRMFLISLLIFMFAADWAVNRSGHASVHVHDVTKTSTHSYQVGQTKVVVADVSDVKQALQETESEHGPFLG